MKKSEKGRLKEHTITRITGHHPPATEYQLISFPVWSKTVETSSFYQYGHKPKLPLKITLGVHVLMIYLVLHCLYCRIRYHMVAIDSSCDQTSAETRLAVYRNTVRRG